METYRVFVKLDACGNICAINSDAFIGDASGWVQIDEGEGVTYQHAQGNYLPLPIMDARGVCRYKLVDGIVIERTAEEMDADYMPPENVQTDAERIAALEEELQAAKILLGVAR